VIHRYRNPWAAVSHDPENFNREMRPSKRNTEANRGDGQPVLSSTATHDSGIGINKKTVADSNSR
jgi:hypothetical protein